MIIRYSLTATADMVARRFLADVPEGYTSQFNAAPSHLLPIITQDSPQGISFFYWGGPPSLANKKPLGEKIINTKSELIAEKSVLQKKLIEKRCIIPADGFYQWKKAGKKTTIPYRFTLKDKDLFSIAGLWEEYEDEAGKAFHTFTMITTEANASVLPVAERMPLILNPTHEKQWLETYKMDVLFEILKNTQPSLDFYSVSPMVNNPDKNDRLVIIPAPASDQFGNLTLFD